MLLLGEGEAEVESDVMVVGIVAVSAPIATAQHIAPRPDAIRTATVHAASAIRRTYRVNLRNATI